MSAAAPLSCPAIGTTDVPERPALLLPNAWRHRLQRARKCRDVRAPEPVEPHRSTHRSSAPRAGVSGQARAGSGAECYGTHALYRQRVARRTNIRRSGRPSVARSPGDPGWSGGPLCPKVDTMTDTDANKKIVTSFIDRLF